MSVDETLSYLNRLAEHIPYAHGKPRRWLVSHCGGCRQPQGTPHIVAVFASEGRQHVIIYSLCRGCTATLERRNEKGRQRFAEQVERNLEALGAHAETPARVQA